MATLRSLLVTLGLNSAQYRSDLEKSKKQTKKDFGDMSKAANKYAKEIGSGVTIASAAVVSGAAFVRMLANQNRELEVNARLAGVTASEFQQLDFVYKQMGLTVDQVSDIYKDSSERIGEWLSSQSGPLQDFGDTMGYTKGEIDSFAESMKDASGQEVLQSMVNQMQAAGVSAKEMSFALEGMGSEATRMIPALIDNGREANKLSEQYRSLNESIALNPQEVQNYKDLSAAFDLFTSTASNTLTKVIAPLADEMAELANATSFWMASMIEGSESQLTQNLVDLNEEAKELRTQIKYLENRGYSNVFQNDAEEAERLRGELEKNRQVYDQTQKDLIKLSGIGSPTSPLEIELKPKIVTPTKTFGELFGGTDQVDTYALEQSKMLSAQADAMAERLIQSQMSLEEQHEMEREFLEKNVSDYETYLQAKDALDSKYKQKKAMQEAQVQQIMFDAQASNLNTLKQGFDGIAQYAEEGSAIAKAAFVASQLVAASQIMVSAEQAKWQAASTIPNAAAQATVMASIDAQKYVSLGLVAAQTGAGLAGMAHDGTSGMPGGRIPKEGTWLLDKGEKVSTKGEADRMDKIMGMIESGSSSGGVQVIVQGSIYGDKETERIIETAANRGYQKSMIDARTNGALYKQMKR
ncbi:tail length tape measure protein [Vibrio phage K394]